ncbi:unnamed protein product [Closterium sp. NIES-65]|nr:unnamed protein product [Closterium sp. NIES-65]
MEVRVVQSAATTAKPAESISEGASDARPTCTQLAAITPPEAAALVPEEDFSDIEETRVGSSHLRARCCQAYPSPLPSPSLIRSHPISALRCSSPSLIRSHPISALRCSSPSLILSHPISALRCSSPSLILSHPISALRCSSPSLIRSHPISALRCSSLSPPLLVALSLRLRFPLRHAPLSAYLPLPFPHTSRSRLSQHARVSASLRLPSLSSPSPRAVPFPRAYISAPSFRGPLIPSFSSISRAPLSPVLLYLPGSSISRAPLSPGLLYLPGSSISRAPLSPVLLYLPCSSISRAPLSPVLLYLPGSSISRAPLSPGLLYLPCSSISRAPLSPVLLYLPGSSISRAPLSPGLLYLPGSSISRAPLSPGLLYLPGSSISRAPLSPVLLYLPCSSISRAPLSPVLLYLPCSSIPSPSFHPLIVPSSYIHPTAAPPSPPTAHVFPTDHVERYIHYKLHELFSLAGPDRHVSILYIHTECESLNDNPLLAFRDIFQGLPPSLQQRVGAVYILHPSLTLRLGLWLISPWLSDSLYSRMVCVSRVEFLWEHIREDQVDLPDFCLAHDGKLEAHPLLDYGFQLDRVAAGQHLPVGL